MNNTGILLLDKIYYLGKRLEKNRLYTLLDPWDFNCSDPIEVQKAGEKISNFIGLKNLNFIITYAPQKENVAGHIVLNNNNDQGVFIEIDDKYKYNNKIVLAILAHEICHKLIHYYGLEQFGYENEILTDVATVYTGLGKLSLNGCEDEYIPVCIHGDFKTSISQKVGYLNINQFAFVYKVLCRMRRIPEKYMLDYLSLYALKALDRVQFDESDELFYNESVIDLVSKTINDKLNDMQIDFALNYKAQRTLKHYLDSAHELYIASHMKMKSVSAKLIETAKQHHDIESLNFIKNLIIIRELDFIDEKFENEENELPSLNSLFINWINDLLVNKTAFTVIDKREYLYSIECPICRCKMSLKQDKLVKIKCNNCHYSFIIDNTKFKRIKNDQPKLSLKSKIKEIISIIKR